jgi:hypothetical protein
MSVDSALNDKWGLSDVESMSSSKFKHKMNTINAQRRRFANLQSVLGDRREMVENVLQGVYSDLD